MWGVFGLSVEIWTFGSPGGLQILTFSKCWASPPHLAKVGLRQIPSSATSKCARSSTSGAPTTPSDNSLCSRCWLSLRSPPSSYGMRWSESVAAKSCDNSIALKPQQSSLPARSWCVVTNSNALGSRYRHRCSSWQCACVRGWMSVSSKCQQIERRRRLPLDMMALTTWSRSSRSLKRSRRIGTRRSLTMVSFRCSITSSPT